MSAVERIRLWRHNPVQFVQDNFKVTPDIWQEMALRSFVSNDHDKIRITLQACAGPGKAQPYDTLITMGNGDLKLFGELNPGDLILGSGGLTRVTHIHERGTRDVYKVSFSDGTSTESCLEHLWTVVDRGKKHTYSTKELIYKLKTNNRRYLKLPQPSAVTYNSSPPLPIDPYTLGAWLGDGHSKTSRMTCFDSEIMERIGGTVRNKDKGVYCIPSLITKLKKIGLGSCSTYDKFIPREFLTASIEDRISLLQGLMDTDGCIDKRDGHCEISLSSSQLIEDAAYLVRSLGGLAKMQKSRIPFYTNKEGEKVPGAISYRLTINTPFNPFFLKRKAAYWKRSDQRYRTRYITKVEYSRETKTRCITVDAADSLYLTNDFIITHNSAVLAWCGWLFLSCYGEVGEHPKGAAVSVTWDNLKDNLWVELAKWQNRSAYLSAAFTWTQTKIYANDHKETWFLSARSFPKGADTETLGATLSGIHSKYVLFLIDESGDIPPQIAKTAEQAVGETLGRKGFVKVLQAGNPISLDGLLYQSSKADDWYKIRITGDPDDPSRSPRINKDWAREQISKYGEDDPWVMSYILGRFPTSSINSLLSVDEVEDAMNRTLQTSDYTFSQKRLGVDVAREGLDSTVIFPRQGLASFKYIQMRNATGPDIAARIVMAKVKWKNEMEFIDNTGGFGSSVIDSLIQGGHNPVGINFSSKAIDERYYNKRAEMWMNMAEWVKRGGALPKCETLKKELTTPTYSFKKGRLILEDKDQIKKRLGFSPDIADALALTFAIPDMPASDEFEYIRKLSGGTNFKSEYDPFKESRDGN